MYYHSVFCGLECYQAWVATAGSYATSDGSGTR